MFRRILLITVLFFILPLGAISQIEWDIPMPVVNIGHSSPIIFQQFGHQSNKLLTLDSSGVVKIWDVESGTNLITITNTTGKIYSAEFSPMDHWVIVKVKINSKTLFDVQEFLTSYVYSVNSGSQEFESSGNELSISADDLKIFTVNSLGRKYEIGEQIDYEYLYVYNTKTRKSKATKISFKHEHILLMALDNDFLICLTGDGATSHLRIQNLLTSFITDFPMSDEYGDVKELRKTRVIQRKNGIVVFYSGYDFTPMCDELFIGPKYGISNIFQRKDSLNKSNNFLVLGNFYNQVEVSAQNIVVSSPMKEDDDYFIQIQFDSISDSMLLPHGLSSYSYCENGGYKVGYSLKKLKNSEIYVRRIVWFDTEMGLVSVEKDFPRNSLQNRSYDNRFIAISYGTTIGIYDPKSGIILRKIGVQPCSIKFFSVSKSRERLFLVCGDTLIRIYNFKLLDIEAEYKFCGSPILNIFLSHDGSKFVVDNGKELCTYTIGSILQQGKFNRSIPDSLQLASKYIDQPIFIENLNLDEQSNNSIQVLNIGCLTGYSHLNSHGYSLYQVTSKDQTVSATFKVDQEKISIDTIINGKRRAYTTYRDFNIESVSIDFFHFSGTDKINDEDGDSFYFDDESAVVKINKICFSRNLKYLVIDESDQINSNYEYNADDNFKYKHSLKIYPIYKENVNGKSFEGFSYWQIDLNDEVDTMFIDSSDNYLIVLYKNSWGKPSDIFYLDGGRKASKGWYDMKFNSPVANHQLVYTKSSESSIELQAIAASNGVRTAGWIYNTTEAVYFIMPCSYYHTDKDELNALSFRYQGNYFPVEDFDNYFNRPDHIVKNHLDFSDTLLIGAYKMAYEKRIKKAGIIDKGPFIYSRKGNLTGGYFPGYGPSITIKNASGIHSLTHDSVLEFHGIIKDSISLLESYSVTVNGVPLWGNHGKKIAKGKKVINFDEIIELIPGKNKIQFTALDTLGFKGQSQVVFVNYVPTDPIKPKLYFYGIGVSNYLDSNYTLRYATKDVRDICKSIYGSKCYSEVIVDTLLDKNATKENIKTLHQKMMLTNPDDVVIVYVSGHGLLDDSLDFYYATYDVDFNHPNDKGISFDMLEGLLDSIPSRKKLLLMDACHSGVVDKDYYALLNPNSQNLAGTKGKITPQESFRGPTKVITPAQENQQRNYQMIGEMFVNFSGNTGTIVISGSSGYGYALEGPEWNNGVFTYCFINGLKNKMADTDKDGEVTVRELKSYLEKSVSELTEGRQKPNIRKEVLENEWRIF